MPARISRTAELMWKDFPAGGQERIKKIKIAAENSYGKVLGARPSWRAVSETAPICCWIAVCCTLSCFR